MSTPQRSRAASPVRLRALSAPPPIDLPSEGLFAAALLADRTAFASLREEWNALLEDGPHRFPFQCWEYLDCAWEHFASPRVRPVIITLRDAHGSLAGGLPLMIGQPGGFPRNCFRYLGFLSCHHGDEGEWADLLAAPGLDRQVASEFARILSQDLRGEWDVMAWSSVPAASPAFALFQDALQSHGVHLQSRELEAAPYIDLRQSPTVVEPVSSKLRRNLRSLLRKIQSQVQVKVGGRDLPHEEALRHTLHLHNLRWGYDRKGGNPHDAFHLDLANRLEPRGENFSLSVTIDGELAAGTYGYIRHRTYYGILMGWDPKFSHLSMGHVIVDAALREARARGVEIFEFLGGGGDYKKRWTESETAYVRWEGTNPHSLRARGYLFLQNSRAWLRPRRDAPESAEEPIAA